jgi:hypothetical protein
MENDKNIILNFDDALSALNDASQTFKIDAWIPSKSLYYSFKEINAKQQKDLLGAAIDNSIYNVEFSTVFYNILKENILNVDYNVVDEFTISDKASVALTLRKQISDSLKVVFDEKQQVSSNINLDEIINKFQNYKTPDNQILDLQNLKIQVRYPTIKLDLSFDNEFSFNKKRYEIKTNEDLQTVITSAFLLETTKYISNVWIDDKEIDLDTLTYNQKIKVIEKLPSGLIQKILKLVSSWKKDLDDILTVEYNDYKKLISIDGLLFLN